MLTCGPALNEVSPDERIDNEMAEDKTSIQVATIGEYRRERRRLLTSVISLLDKYLPRSQGTEETKEATTADSSEEGNEEARTSQAVDANLGGVSPPLMSEPAELLEQNSLASLSEPVPSNTVDTSAAYGWLWLILLALMISAYSIFVVSSQTSVL